MPAHREPMIVSKVRFVAVGTDGHGQRLYKPSGLGFTNFTRLRTSKQADAAMTIGANTD
jgi:hypothetical protein